MKDAYFPFTVGGFKKPVSSVPRITEYNFVILTHRTPMATGVHLLLIWYWCCNYWNAPFGQVLAITQTCFQNCHPLPPKKERGLLHSWNLFSNNVELRARGSVLKFCSKEFSFLFTSLQHMSTFSKTRQLVKEVSMSVTGSLSLQSILQPHT